MRTVKLRTRSLVGTFNSAHSTGDECILDCGTNAPSIGKTGAIPSSSASGSHTGPETRCKSSSRKVVWAFCPAAFSAELAKKTWKLICSLNLIVFIDLTFGNTRHCDEKRWVVSHGHWLTPAFLPSLCCWGVYMIYVYIIYHIVYTCVYWIGASLPHQLARVRHWTSAGIWSLRMTKCLRCFSHSCSEPKHTMCDSCLVAPGFLTSAGTKNLSDTFEASATLQLFQPLRKTYLIFYSLIWSARIEVLREWLCDRGHWLGPHACMSVRCTGDCCVR